MIRSRPATNEYRANWDAIFGKKESAPVAGPNRKECPICHDMVLSLYTHQHCPKCGAHPRDQEVRNHSLMWHDGDVVCTKCETYVRAYDAG